jgi:hypothetical protein
MRFDPFDGRGVDIVIAQAIGLGGKSFRKRADRLPRRRLNGMVLRARNPRSDRECGSACCQPQKCSARKFHGVSSMSRWPQFGTIPAAFGREWIGCQPKRSWV